MKFKFGKFFLSLILDFIGSLSYFIPFVGELFDLIWSPIYAIIIQAMYNNGYGTFFAMFEELMPGTDIIPSATILFFLEYFGVLK